MNQFKFNNYSKDLRNYYLLNKSHVKKFFGFSFLFGSLFYLNKKYKIKSYLINDPLMDILNSKEVKGAGIVLIEDLFKDSRTKQSVLFALKDVIREKKFEDHFKVFIKEWLFKVIKDQEFLRQTNTSLIEVVKTTEVLNETASLLKFMANEDKSKQTAADVMKDVWLSEDVLSKLSALFENCAKTALQTDRLKAYGGVFATDIWSDNEFRAILYSKALDLYSDLEEEKEARTKDMN